MNDTEFTMFVFLWIFGGVIVLQSVRLLLLRRKFERLAMKTVGATDIADLSKPVAGTNDPQELARIRERLHVLERIATDKPAALEQEFEALRRT